jgi:hypothetical protein
VTRIGTGESEEREPFQAGARAAQAALRAAGTASCDFVLMFATVGYNQEKLLRGVRSVTGDARLCGCSGAGIITQTGPHGEVAFTLSGTDTEMETVGVMVFSSNEIRFDVCAAEGLKGRAEEAGKALGAALAGLNAENPRLLLLFPDGYAVNMNGLFRGLEAALPAGLPAAGGLSGHNLPLSSLTYQYYDDRVLTDAVVGALVSGPVDVGLGVSHGCLPIGVEKKVTKAKGNLLQEIDGRPAWSFFKEYLDEDVDEIDVENATFISVGEKLPDALATAYDRYIIRAPFLKNPDGSIAFATEFREGAVVRMMRRDEEKISAGSAQLARRLRDARRGAKPAAVFQFDCAGRGKMFFGERVKEKEVDVMQDVLGKDVPWLGLFCFGEIAPIGGINHHHNQTVVLCTLSLRGSETTA